MHFAEGTGLEQIVDGGSGVARAGVAAIGKGGRRKQFAGLVGADIESAFAGMRHKAKHYLHFLCCH